MEKIRYGDLSLGLKVGFFIICLASILHIFGFLGMLLYLGGGI